MGDRPPPATSPLVRELRTFMPIFVRAVKAVRLYPEKSDMRQQQLEAAMRGLVELLSRHKTLTLQVRDGAFLSNEEDVYLDDDVRNGPTHFLAGHAIFELTMEDGVTAQELATFISILAEDPRFRCRVGEDLVTLFWRFHLEHIRHRYVDVLRVAVRTDGATRRRAAIVDDEETARLQAELARIVRVLAIDEASGEDIAEIIDRDLEASENLRSAADGDRRRFESAIALAETRVSRRYLDAIRLDIDATRSHEFLAERMSDLLIEALRAEPNPQAARASSALAVFVSLFEGMLRDRHFDTALHIIRRVRATGRLERTAMEGAVARMILEAISGEATARTAVIALDRSEAGEDQTKILSLLEGLGDDSIPHVLKAIDLAEKDSARVSLAQLAVNITPHRRSDLYELMRSGRWEVALDLLQAAVSLNPRERAELIAIGVVHSHPAVRAEAFRGLVRFAAGRPDDFLARGLRDQDAGVRAVVLRTIAARKNANGVKAIGALLARDDVFDRDPNELRLVLLAYAVAGGAGAVPELERLLGASSGIASDHKGLESVAFALSVIETAGAKELLQKGAKSLNPFLRGACKTALAQGGKTELLARGIVSTENSAMPVDMWPDISPSRMAMVAASPPAARMNIPPTPAGSWTAPSFGGKTPATGTMLPVAPPRPRASVTGIPLPSPAKPDEPPPLLPDDALSPIEE